MLKYAKAAFDVAGTALMIVAASALLWRMYQTPARPTSPSQIEELSGVSLDAEKISNTRGNGRVVLIEFGDYECPFCARHQKQTGQFITEKFVTTGSIQHAFLNFPLDIHPRAPEAAEAAECAARQSKFWEMHDSLFENQKALETASLKERAAALGLNEAEFTECLDSDETARVVERDQEEGRRLGVRGTPAFFLGLRRLDGTIDLKKKLNGALEFSEFEKAINELMTTQRAQR
jgi:protein-disulfide isomerase